MKFYTKTEILNLIKNEEEVIFDKVPKTLLSIELIRYMLYNNKKVFDILSLYWFLFENHEILELSKKHNNPNFIIFLNSDEIGHHDINEIVEFIIETDMDISIIIRNLINNNIMLDCNDIENIINNKKIDISEILDILNFDYYNNIHFKYNKEYYDKLINYHNSFISEKIFENIYEFDFKLFIEKYINKFKSINRLKENIINNCNDNVDIIIEKFELNDDEKKEILINNPQFINQKYIKELNFSYEDFISIRKKWDIKIDILNSLSSRIQNIFNNDQLSERGEIINIL